MKAMTNYAVTLEKLGKRSEALEVFDQLKFHFRDEIRIYNNLGIIHKRAGNVDEAQQNYEEALQIDEGSFFPNYNIGVLKAHLNDSESLVYFEKALRLAQESKEEVYEINVLINMGLVYEKKGEIENAIERLEAALKIDESNQKIKSKLA